MEKDAGNKIRLGLFVTVAIVLFIAGIFLIGQRQRMFVPTIRIRFVCANVNGLQPGNKARFSGIDVGSVENVTLITDTSVRVDILVERRVKKFIKKDAQASIGSEGLMGDKVVNIAPGSPEQKEIENNETIQCVEGSSMDQIMSHVTVIAANAEQITSDVAAITDNIRQGKGAVGKLFMDTAFATNLDKSIINIKQGTKGFSQNMEAAKSNFLLKPYFKKKEKEKEKAEQDKLNGQGKQK